MKIVAMRLKGSCRSGIDRSGDIYHAVPERETTALCGRTYGRTSAGWSDVLGDEVTCPRCLRKMQRLEVHP